ncbi:hypothetical protein [Kineosporia babensis]|uniref:Uncharacterized protein n=1 Tax=Kineosporia babensis TaxID=499548 RepID=A0A9X1SSN5_9ACTN|nr:hypothetical protein [Kineosporia babensis]MCD5310857.1 hypothetical protein [Kineosporia babensis]
MRGIFCSSPDHTDIQFADVSGGEAQTLADAHNTVWHGGGQYATGS